MGWGGVCVRVCVCQNMKDKAGPNLSGDGAPKLGTVPAGAVQAELARPSTRAITEPPWNRSQRWSGYDR